MAAEDPTLTVDHDALTNETVLRGLTEAEVQVLVGTIRGLKAEGLTIIWIEHVLHALTSVVERLLVLDFGKVIGIGDPDMPTPDFVIEALAEAAAADPARTPLFLPYLSGERTPINDPRARGVTAGLSLRSTRGDLYLALLQGIAYATRANLETMRDLGTPVLPRRFFEAMFERLGERVERVKYGVDEDVCTGDHACIRLSGCPTLTLKDNPDPLKVDPVATVIEGCVGCGLCGENAHAAVLCPSFYRAEIVQNPHVPPVDEKSRTFAHKSHHSPLHLTMGAWLIIVLTISR